MYRYVVFHNEEAQFLQSVLEVILKKGIETQVGKNGVTGGDKTIHDQILLHPNTVTRLTGVGHTTEKNNPFLKS